MTRPDLFRALGLDPGMVRAPEQIPRRHDFRAAAPVSESSVEHDSPDA